MDERRLLADAAYQDPIFQSCGARIALAVALIAAVLLIGTLLVFSPERVEQFSEVGPCACSIAG